MQIFAHSQGLRYAPIWMLNRNVWKIELCGRFSVTINSELLDVCWPRLGLVTNYPGILQVLYNTFLTPRSILRTHFVPGSSSDKYGHGERVNIATTTSSLTTRIEVFSFNEWFVRLFSLGHDYSFEKNSTFK